MSILGDEPTGLALLSGAIVGLSLGLTGAGGSLLTIPLLVYVLKLGLHEVMAIHMWRHSRSESAESLGTLARADSFPPSCFVKVGSIGLIVGLLSGFFGVGGGFVIVPALSLILGFPMRASIGTSLLIIAFTSIGGVAGHLQFGEIPGGLLATLLLGSAAGIGLGATVGRWLSAEITVKVFAALTIGVAVTLMFDNVPKVFVLLS